MQTYKLHITGLDCPDCAKALEKGICQMPQVKNASLNFYAATLTVNGDISLDALKREIKLLGHEVADPPATPSQPQKGRGLLRFASYLWQRLEVKLALFGILLVSLAALIEPHAPAGIILLIRLVAIGAAGWHTAKNAIITLWKSRMMNMNFLMMVAGIGAVIIGEYGEVAAMLALFSISEAIESYTNDRARAVLAELSELAPLYALKLTPSGENITPVEALAVGDLILVKSGERVPMDGVVEEGSSQVNQSPITGESMPVEKTIGDTLFSGSINGEGVLKVRITHLAKDNTINRIIQLVTEAQNNRATSHQFIDRFAQIYTPVMVLVALLVATIPTLVFQQPLLNVGESYGWLYRALSLLVIGCPCALVISTPVTLVSSLTRAARAGVVFKGGIFMEGLSRIDAIAFDKTGTLTQGNPEVVRFAAQNCAGTPTCAPCDDLLALACALEKHSTHPMQRAILAAGEKHAVIDRYPPAENLQTRTGKGIQGSVNGNIAAIGSPTLFAEEHDTPQSLLDQVQQAEARGETAMLVCDGERVRGYISVADQLRAESAAVMETLHKMGKKTILLTGDHQKTAQNVAQSLGIADIRAQLLPEEKMSAIEQLKQVYGRVIMVGDGINDSPALARADIGVAMGGRGSAQALETADIVLMGDDLTKLPFAIQLSKFTNALIRQNIAISLGTKLVVAALALAGITPLWLAVVADMGVSLLVTFNGMRALRFQA